MKDNIVSVRLENDDYDLLLKLSRIRGESLSDVIRGALRKNLSTQVPSLSNTTTSTISHVVLL